MKWDDVQIFLEIARTGSLAAAGRALGLNHSTIYRRINSLEGSLRVRLFDRHGGQYTLTSAGRDAYPHAIEVEEGILALQRSIVGKDEEPIGPVTLTAPESLLRLLAPHLASFRAAYPGISLQVIFSDRFFDLSRREADVALRPTVVPPEDSFGRKIANLAWTIYRPADHNPTRDGVLPWGIYTDDLQRLRASVYWKQHHESDPVLLSVNSVPAMQAVICAARCQGFLPCFVGDPDPTLQRVCPPIVEADSMLWLLVHPDLRRTTRVRALLDHLWKNLSGYKSIFEGVINRGEA